MEIAWLDQTSVFSGVPSEDIQNQSLQQNKFVKNALGYANVYTLNRTTAWLRQERRPRFFENFLTDKQ